MVDVIRSRGLIGEPYLDAPADQQPVELVFCNPDLLWKSDFSQSRLGQGAFREAFQAVYQVRCWFLGRAISSVRFYGCVHPIGRRGQDISACAIRQADNRDVQVRREGSPRATGRAARQSRGADATGVSAHVPDAGMTDNRTSVCRYMVGGMYAYSLFTFHIR